MYKQKEHIIIILSSYNRNKRGITYDKVQYKNKQCSNWSGGGEGNKKKYFRARILFYKFNPYFDDIIYGLACADTIKPLQMSYQKGNIECEFIIHVCFDNPYYKKICKSLLFVDILDGKETSKEILSKVYSFSEKKLKYII